MRILISIIIISLLSCGNTSKEEKKIDENSEKVTTYYFIRHAEKERGPEAGNDPDLTQLGKERAMRWKTYFSEIPLDAIYSTDLNRTRQTASPIAASKGVPITFYDPSNLYSTEFKLATEGKSVLVVGHSNTTPAFVNAIIGSNKHEDIGDRENGMIYKVEVDSYGTATETVEQIN